MAKNAKGKAKPAIVKRKITRAIPVGAQIPCVDNSGAKLLNVISVYFIGSRLNRLPSATLGDMMLASVRQGKPELKKKGKNLDDLCSSTLYSFTCIFYAEFWIFGFLKVFETRKEVREGSRGCLKDSNRV